MEVSCQGRVPTKTHNRCGFWRIEPSFPPTRNATTISQSFVPLLSHSFLPVLCSWRHNYYLKYAGLCVRCVNQFSGPRKNVRVHSRTKHSAQKQSAIAHRSLHIFCKWSKWLRATTGIQLRAGVEISRSCTWQLWDSSPLDAECCSVASIASRY
jgi:hypothetical protein